MSFGITIGSLMVIITASGTFIFCFGTIILEGCTVFLPIIVEGQSNFCRASWILMFIPPLEKIIGTTCGLLIFILSR